MRGGWVYIMADRYRGTIYIGVTSDLVARVWAHREGRGSKFCSRYGLTRLVCAEQAPTMHEAIACEKAMKKWSRAWKIELIERANPIGTTCGRLSSDRHLTVTAALEGHPRESGGPVVFGRSEVKRAGFPLSRE